MALLIRLAAQVTALGPRAPPVVRITVISPVVGRWDSVAVRIPGEGGRFHMSVVEGGPSSAGLVARVQNILLKPKEEWAVIDKEAATVQGLFTGYAMLLAAIPAVASVIGQFLLLHNTIAAL